MPRIGDIVKIKPLPHINEKWKNKTATLTSYREYKYWYVEIEGKEIGLFEDEFELIYIKGEPEIGHYSCKNKNIKC